MEPPAQHAGTSSSSGAGTAGVVAAPPVQETKIGRGARKRRRKRDKRRAASSSSSRGGQRDRRVHRAQQVLAREDSAYADHLHKELEREENGKCQRQGRLLASALQSSFSQTVDETIVAARQAAGSWPSVQFSPGPPLPRVWDTAADRAARRLVPVRQ